MLSYASWKQSLSGYWQVLIATASLKLYRLLMYNLIKMHEHTIHHFMLSRFLNLFFHILWNDSENVPFV